MRPGEAIIAKIPQKTRKATGSSYNALLPKNVKIYDEASDSTDFENIFGFTANTSGKTEAYKEYRDYTAALQKSTYPATRNRKSFR